MPSDDYNSLSQTPRDREMDKHLLSRRQFNALCAAVGLSLPTAGAVIEVLSGASVLAADAPPHTVKLPNGTIVPAVGQGSWHLGQGRHPAALEEEALRSGISLGMTLIDTSGNYGNGRSEELISHVIAGQRERVFLVTAGAGKWNAGRATRHCHRRPGRACGQVRNSFAANLWSARDRSF